MFLIQVKAAEAAFRRTYPAITPLTVQELGVYPQARILVSGIEVDGECQRAVSVESVFMGGAKAPCHTVPTVGTWVMPQLTPPLPILPTEQPDGLPAPKRGRAITNGRA